MEQVNTSKKEMPEMTENEEAEVKGVSQLRAERDEYDQLQVHFDAKHDKKLLRRIDMRLLPTLATFYLVAFVDRSNIGNAKLQHLEEDLLLTPQQFSWYSFPGSPKSTWLILNRALTIFFFSYSLFEVPSNLVLKFLKPSIWLPAMMLGWGVTMTLMGFAATTLSMAIF